MKQHAIRPLAVPIKTLTWQAILKENEHGLQSELSTTELSDLLVNGHKSSVYSTKDVYKSIMYTQLSQNDEL